MAISPSRKNPVRNNPNEKNVRSPLNEASHRLTHAAPAAVHAIQAAKLNKKVGIIERKRVVGGVCINTGTIPSKALREAVLYLSGFRQRTIYGASYRLKKTITVEDLASDETAAPPGNSAGRLYELTGAVPASK